MLNIKKENMDTTKELSLNEQPVITSSPRTKKTSKWFSFVLGNAMVAIAILSFVFFGPTVLNVFAQTTLSPAEYYQSVEKSNLDKQIDSLSKGYGYYLDNYKKTATEGVGTETTLKATLDPSITNLMGLEGLKSIKASILSMQNSKKSKSIISLFTNDKKFTSLDFLSDTENNLAYILIPELSKSYLKTTTNSEYGELSETALPFTAEEITAFLNDNPLSEELLNKLLKKYTALLVAEINNVAISNEDIVTAGGVTAKYTKLTTNLDAKTVLSMKEKVLTAAKDDTDLLNLCVEFKLCTESEYSTLIQVALGALSYKKSQLIEDNSKKDEVVVMNVWVDDNGEITGRDFSFISDSTESSFGYKTTKKESNIGFEAWFATDNNEEVKLVGHLGISSKGVIGDVKFTYDDPSMETAKVYNMKLRNVSYSFKDSIGYINGVITLTDESLPDMSIAIDCTGNTKQQSMKFDFVQGGINLVSVLMDTKVVPFKDFKLPAKGTKMYDAETQMDDYLLNSNIKKYLEGINKKIDVKGINAILENLIYSYSTY